MFFKWNIYENPGIQNTSPGNGEQDEASDGTMSEVLKCGKEKKVHEISDGILLETEQAVLPICSK